MKYNVQREATKLTAHLLSARFEVEKHNAVATRVHNQVLLHVVHIALHIRLQPEQVPVAQYIAHRASIRHYTETDLIVACFTK